jgi:hypothetical protein
MKDVSPWQISEEPSKSDADILSKIHCLVQRILLTVPQDHHRPTLLADFRSRRLYDPRGGDEGRRLRKANSHKTNIELENVMDDPDGSRQRLKNAFLGTGLVVDEAHTVLFACLRVFGRQPAALADRGADRGASARRRTTTSSLDPESMEVEQGKNQLQAVVHPDHCQLP